MPLVAQRHSLDARRNGPLGTFQRDDKMDQRRLLSRSNYFLPESFCAYLPYPCCMVERGIYDAPRDEFVGSIPSLLLPYDDGGFDRRQRHYSSARRC